MHIVNETNNFLNLENNITLAYPSLYIIMSYTDKRVAMPLLVLSIVLSTMNYQNVCS